MIINPKDLIINRHDKQTGKQRALGVIILIAFWGFFLYLLRPILIVAGWAISYYIFRTVAVNAQAQEIIRVIFLVYLPIVMILSFSFWAWAAYNRLRFQGSRDKRRRPSPYTSLKEIAASAYLMVEALNSIRRSRRVTCHFNQDGEISQINCRLQENPPPPTTKRPPLFNGEEALP